MNKSHDPKVFDPRFDNVGQGSAYIGDHQTFAIQQVLDELRGTSPSNIISRLPEHLEGIRTFRMGNQALQLS